MARTAILYIAERCNQSCVFCLEEDGTWNEFVDPSTQQVFDTLRALRDRGAAHITFMGGETFFRKDLGRILTEARRVGFTRLGVTTNGTVLSKRGFVSDLVAAGLEFIEFSVHGHTEELANTIGGTHFTFERQAEALAEINELGSLHTIVNVVICRENKDHLTAIARHVHETYPRIPARFKFKFVSMLGLALERATRDDVLRYDEVDFVAVGDYLDSVGVPYWFYNVPLCHLGRHAEHSHELGVLASDETYFDFDHRGRSEYYDSSAQLEGRVFPERTCASCVASPLCPGIEESYRLLAGDVGRTGIVGDPMRVLEGALRDRNLDPALAPERFAALSRRPRPPRFIRARAEGAVRFRSPDAPEPFDIQVEPRRDGAPAFVTTPSYALSYRRWSDGDPGQREDIRLLLDHVVDALKRADGAGLDLESTRASVSRVSVAGFAAEAPEPLAQRKKRIALPVVAPATRASDAR